jgi:hypothetical protein
MTEQVKHLVAANMAKYLPVSAYDSSVPSLSDMTRASHVCTVEY